MKTMVKLIFNGLDIIISIFLILELVIWSASIYLFSHLFRLTKSRESRKRILFFVSSAYVDLKKKGVLGMIQDREERGYFDFVYTIHPFLPQTQTINISDKNILIEYGTERYDRLKNLGLKFARRILILHSLLCFSVNLIKKENISIIRGNSPYLAGFIALVCSKLTHPPFCVSIHADHEHRYKILGPENAPVYFGSHKLAKRLERFVLSQADMVMPIRESLANYAVNNGAKPEKIRVIPHGVELTPFLKPPDPQLKRELGVEDKRIISFVGRLAKENYVRDVVEIASQVCQRRKDALFLMVGDGKERQYLEQLSQDLGLNDSNIKFLGFQPYEKVAQIRLVSDVSLCLMAGFSLIEAAAAGTPIVAYDVDWHYELVKDGETGFLLPEGDIQGAANAIVKLLDDPQLGKRLGENARKLAIDRHSVENTSKIKVKWYQELIGS